MLASNVPPLYTLSHYNTCLEYAILRVEISKYQSPSGNSPVRNFLSEFYTIFQAIPPKEHWNWEELGLSLSTGTFSGIIDFSSEFWELNVSVFFYSILLIRRKLGTYQ